MPDIAVIGGGTPFTINLIHEMARQWAGLEQLDVRLTGRRSHNTELVARYAAAAWSDCPGWQVRASASFEDAVAGADLIIHQARFGGLQGRASDEEFGAQWGVPADESLGPTGLRAALRLRRSTLDLTDRIAAHNPSAWIVPMTNPLSVTTQILARRLGDRVIGICDLPIHALESIATLAAVPARNISYAYTGLNHRGFLYGINIGGMSLHGKMAQALRAKPLDWVDAQEFADLDAMPMAYHKVVKGNSFRESGRARHLADISDRALQQLAAAPQVFPSALRERETPWYEKAVVPLTGALLGFGDFKGVLNLPGEEISRERLCVVAKGRVVPYQNPPVPPGVAAWTSRFGDHEHAVMHAVLTPSPESLKACLEQDPICPGNAAEAIAKTLWDEFTAENGEQDA
ncbi:hypothetical protein ADK57_25135 [Streptomyces sp. MMG1533]|uniref:family 4 glycosyl hydrolase n=1 Tax=Streptomyces sp. MMG1533 TaxID=1415546 RepID=UPI0006AE6EB6|nr:hypothetical protein [Streptomyces sp. MMG1533]KOU62159.1 hypothetical protein ADK57_25135 [Streptomyces sp. MMG1533]